MPFDRKVYDEMKAEVRAYLDGLRSLEEKRSILLFGRGGEGRTYLMDELKEEFSDMGYSQFRKMMPQEHGRVTRQQWNNNFVVATTEEQYQNDPRFKVFDFTTKKN